MEARHRHQPAAVSCGYRPTRAALRLAALLAVGTTVFAIASSRSFNGTPLPPFSPLIYTLNLPPVVNSGQVGAYCSQGPEQWLTHTLTIAGGTLATAVAAGIIRVLRRD